RTVDFKNTVIILTSNLGSPLILEAIEKGGEIDEETRRNISLLLRQNFRPEFLNRLDETIIFTPLSKEHITKIIDLTLDSLRTRLSAQRIKLDVTESAKSFIADNGYDPQFGARPLKRYVRQTIETLVAKKIIEGAISEGDTLTVDLVGEEIVIRS
ncbi:MAG: AAA family ATPase, partial [Clostridia bacterium]|nr:AAA family ATPase [Clostridia bacterium]